MASPKLNWIWLGTTLGSECQAAGNVLRPTASHLWRHELKVSPQGARKKELNEAVVISGIGRVEC